jgi:DNA-binding GntR family transcriptional regulator
MARRALQRSTETTDTIDAGTNPNGTSSPDQVVRALIDGVKTGRYVPGQRLIEADLTSELKVSRGPVREALKRLAAEGLVSLVPHRGAYIRKLTRREVHDILVIQEHLTGLAARLATEQIDADGNRAAFAERLEQLLRYRDRSDSVAFLDERARFYEALVTIGGNRELSRFVPVMQIHLLRMQFQQHLSESDRKRQFQEYETLADHILASRGQKAEKAMRQHVRRTRLSIEHLPDDVFAQDQ